MGNSHLCNNLIAIITITFHGIHFDLFVLCLRFDCSYNGFLPQGDKGRRRSKFVLYKRTESNGVKRSRHYVVQSPQTSKAILDAHQHSISYTLSRSQAVIVEYKEDPDTDMFQVEISAFFFLYLFASIQRKNRIRTHCRLADRSFV